MSKARVKAEDDYAKLWAASRIICGTSTGPYDEDDLEDGYVSDTVPADLDTSFVPDAQGFMQARTWPVNASDADDMGIATRAEQDACPSTNIPKTPFFEAVEAIEEEEAHRVSKLADDWAKDNSGTTAMEYLLSATESIWEVVGSGRDPLEVKDQVDADLLAVRSFFDDGGSAVRSAAQAMKTEVGTLSTDEDARDYAKGIKKEKAKNPRTIDWPADSA